MMNYPIGITFTLGGLFKFAYLIIGLAVLVYVFLILKHFYLILKKYSEMLDRNVENFDSLIKDSTEIIHRVNAITEKVPEKAMNVVGELKDSLSLIQLASSILFGFVKKKNKE